MQITLTIEDNLLDRARKATGIQEETALVRAGLEAAASRLKLSEQAIRLRLLSESHADA